MQFLSITGVVTDIRQLAGGSDRTSISCFLSYTVDSQDVGLTHFVISPDTYFIHREIIKVGDEITCYYDANAPVPLIYPPQYHAIVVHKTKSNYFVKVSFFDHRLVSEDGNLKLNINKDTKVFLENGQPFHGPLSNQNLIVLFGPSTRSIPAQTTPYEIIVLCK